MDMHDKLEIVSLINFQKEFKKQQDESKMIEKLEKSVDLLMGVYRTLDDPEEYASLEKAISEIEFCIETMERK